MATIVGDRFKKAGDLFENGPSQSRAEVVRHNAPSGPLPPKVTVNTPLRSNSLIRHATPAYNPILLRRTNVER